MMRSITVQYKSEGASILNEEGKVKLEIIRRKFEFRCNTNKLVETPPNN